jgi:hypothetical protein
MYNRLTIIVAIILFSTANTTTFTFGLKCTPDGNFCKNDSDCCQKKCYFNSLYGGTCGYTDPNITCKLSGEKCDGKYHKCCGNMTCSYKMGNGYQTKCCIPKNMECLYYDDNCCESGNGSTDIICMQINGAKKCQECVSDYLPCSINGLPCCNHKCKNGFCGDPFNN